MSCNYGSQPRFLEVLGQQPHQAALRDLFDTLAARLGKVVPDLGRHTAGDRTDLPAWKKSLQKVKIAVVQGVRLTL